MNCFIINKNVEDVFLERTLNAHILIAQESLKKWGYFSFWLGKLWGISMFSEVPGTSEEAWREGRGTGRAGAGRASWDGSGREWGGAALGRTQRSPLWQSGKCPANARAHKTSPGMAWHNHLFQVLLFGGKEERGVTSIRWGKRRWRWSRNRSKVTGCVKCWSLEAFWAS